MTLPFWLGCFKNTLIPTSFTFSGQPLRHLATFIFLFLTFFHTCWRNSLTTWLWLPLTASSSKPLISSKREKAFLHSSIIHSISTPHPLKFSGTDIIENQKNCWPRLQHGLEIINHQLESAIHLQNFLLPCLDCLTSAKCTQDLPLLLSVLYISRFS